MPNVGPREIVIVVVIALLIFGPKRLPELGRGVGHGLREFKGAVTKAPGPDQGNAGAEEPELEAGR